MPPVRYAHRARSVHEPLKLPMHSLSAETTDEFVAGTSVVQTGRSSRCPVVDQGRLRSVTSSRATKPADRYVARAAGFEFSATTTADVAPCCWRARAPASVIATA